MGLCRQLLRRQRRDFYLEVDAIQQWPGKPRLITLDLAGGTLTALAGSPKWPQGKDSSRLPIETELDNGVHDWHGPNE
ncbi:hypothetical protein HSBAA_63320 [Vreelandella sulfidaeris]|uniref:Uncharacterized protein n=1 Tax=Vreelandella sulfidaeris TaxID=115553 RepID=A0A455UFG3_9GAMM|nr:hypothetical protein HSBAA_63320 [Halomonas sulfidaeris]